MLQQTQVATAIPFYQRFLERFPDIAALARARGEDVLACWSGLGYYRRARHLHEAARLVVRDHAGRIPDDPERFRVLPGVGRYTVGAVLSICFDRPLPVLDGNVARVLSRIHALDAGIRDPRGARELWRRAAELVPATKPGEWNQAVMELGARVCTPRAPSCPTCPVRTECRARALGRVDEFPPAPRRRAVERVRRAAVLIARGRRLLMTPRRGSLLDGLWEPPGVDLSPRARARAALEGALARLGVTARLESLETTVRHRITHREIEVEVWRGTGVVRASRSAALRYVDPGERGVAVTALARRLARFTTGAGTRRP